MLQKTSKWGFARFSYMCLAKTTVIKLLHLQRALILFGLSKFRWEKKMSISNIFVAEKKLYIKCICCEKTQMSQKTSKRGLLQESDLFHGSIESNVNPLHYLKVLKQSFAIHCSKSNLWLTHKWKVIVKL